MPGSMTHNTSWIDALIQEPQLSIEIQNGKNRHVRFTHDCDDSDYEPTIEDEASADSDSDDSDYEPTIEDEASADSDSDDSNYEPTIEDEASDGADSDSDDSNYKPTTEDESSEDSDSDFYASEPGCRVPPSYICTNPKLFKSVFSTSLNGENIHTRFLYYDDI